MEYDDYISVGDTVSVAITSTQTVHGEVLKLQETSRDHLIVKSDVNTFHIKDYKCIAKPNVKE